MKNHTKAIIGLLAVSFLAGVSCRKQPANTTAQAYPPLRFYCAAGIRPAMDELLQIAPGLADAEMDYGGSGTLLTRLKLLRAGDLFLPAEDDYVEQARSEGLVASSRTIATVIPVILVRKGNPKGIAGLADLGKPGVRLGLGNARSCQVGRASQELLKTTEAGDAIRANVVFESATVNELGIQVKTGQLDAVIVWDAIAGLYDDCGESIAIHNAAPSRFVIAILNSSTNPQAAREFVDFLTSPKAQAVLAKHGYHPVGETTKPNAQVPNKRQSDGTNDE